MNETSTTEKSINGMPITTSVTKSIRMDSPIIWMGNNGVISNCTFNKNTGLIGGVINWSGKNGSISDSRFNNNRALRAAGAVYSEKTLNINNCSVNNCSSVLSNDAVIMNNLYINKLKKIYQINLMGKKQDLVSAIYITNSNKNKNVVLNKDLITSGYYVNQTYVLTLTQDLGDSTIYSRKFIFNNVKNINDVHDRLFSNNYTCTYTLAKSINVTNQYDYSNVLVKYNAAALKEKIFHKYGMQAYYEHCLYGFKPSFTTALNVNFAKNYNYSPYCPWDISSSGFNLVTVNGNNAMVSVSNDDRAEKKWMILDKSSVVIISDLTVGGFNRAIENKGGIMVLNNVKLTHNRMDYTVDRDWGAAILNLGIVICNNCTFSNNYAKYGGAIFNQGYLSFNNCTFFNNLAYKKGGDVCNSAGSGYKVDVNNTSIYNMDYVEGLSADASALIQVGSVVATVAVSLVVGFVTANIFVGMAAGAGIGALMGGATTVIICSNNYDYRLDRLATGLEIVFRGALCGMFGGIGSVP